MHYSQGLVSSEVTTIGSGAHRFMQKCEIHEKKGFSHSPKIICKIYESKMKENSCTKFSNYSFPIYHKTWPDNEQAKP